MSVAELTNGDKPPLLCSMDTPCVTVGQDYESKSHSPIRLLLTFGFYATGDLGDAASAFGFVARLRERFMNSRNGALRCTSRG